MLSCFDGYLTDGCKTCEYWENTETSLGCAYPFPIMECSYYADAVEKRINKLYSQG